jgi:predicted nucleotidyltransferase
VQTLTEHPLDDATAKTAAAFLARVSRVFDVQQAILFGSRAKGTFTNDSDADVAVLLAGNYGQNGKFMDIKLAMADLAFDVLLDTGIRIEPLPVWEDEWAQPDSYRNPLLLRNIERDGVLLKLAKHTMV